MRWACRTWWWLGRDVGTFGVAVVSGLVVGTMLALLCVGIGLLVSLFSNSNLLSLSISFFALLVLVAPNQMPTDAVRGWAGELLLRLDPFLGGLTYLDKVIINERGFAADLDLLLVPLLAAVAVPAVAMLLAGRLTLLPRAQCMRRWQESPRHRSGAAWWLLQRRCADLPRQSGRPTRCRPSRRNGADRRAGRQFSFESTLRNSGDSQSGLIANLNIVAPIVTSTWTPRTGPPNVPSSSTTCRLGNRLNCAGPSGPSTPANSCCTSR